MLFPALLVGILASAAMAQVMKITRGHVIIVTVKGIAKVLETVVAVGDVERYAINMVIGLDAQVVTEQKKLLIVKLAPVAMAQVN